MNVHYMSQVFILGLTHPYKNGL